MCGEAKPFPDGISKLSGAVPGNQSHNLIKRVGPVRKAEGFPHIRRQSRYNIRTGLLNRVDYPLRQLPACVPELYRRDVQRARKITIQFVIVAQ